MQVNMINKGAPLLPSRVSARTYTCLLELLSIYNPLVGPVQHVVAQLCTPLEVPFYSMVGHHYDLSISLGVQAGPFVPAAGKGKDFASTLLGTLGESAERVLPIVFNDYYSKRMIYATPDEMVHGGKLILGPAAVRLFAPEQYGERFPYRPFRDESLAAWVRGENLATGMEVYAPAQVMAFGYRARHDEAPIAYQHSGGLTCHASKEAGCYHALCEIVERDQINIRWVCNIPPREIDLDELQRRLISVNQYPFLQNPNLEIRVFYWTLDVKGLHVVTVHCVNKSARILKYFPGMGCDLSFKRALEKALGEVGQGERNYFIANLGNEILPSWMNIGPDAKPADITDLFKTLVYYGYPENLMRVERYYESAEKLPLDEILEETTTECTYERLLEVLARNGLTPMYFDLTPPNFYHVFLQKCFIPELTQYFMVYPYFGHPRYYDLPVQLGYRTERLRFPEFNRMPLPFP